MPCVSNNQILFFFFAFLAPQIINAGRLLDTVPGFHTLELYGNETLAYYYVNLFVGTPPQKQTVIVDTGSGITTFPCLDCTGSNCGTHIDEPFNQSASSTYQEVKCNAYYGNYMCSSCDEEKRCKFSISYVEGSSLKGYYLSDFVVVGNEIQDYLLGKTTLSEEAATQLFQSEETNFIFGCTTRETNLFFTQDAAGIMGLGTKTNSSQALPNLIDYMFSSGHSSQLEFSICFGHDGGFMTIGGYNTDKHLEAKARKIQKSIWNDQYRVKLLDFRVGGQSAAVDDKVLNIGSGAFFDSGTTLSYFPRLFRDKMINAIKNHCDADSKKNCGGKGYNRCYDFKDGDTETPESFFQTLPPFQFIFDDGEGGESEYIWYPIDYYFIDKISGSKKTWCFSVEEFSDRIILGGTFMRNYDILFNKTGEYIGFVRSFCSGNEIVDFLVNNSIVGEIYGDNGQPIDQENLDNTTINYLELQTPLSKDQNNQINNDKDKKDSIKKDPEISNKDGPTFEFILMECLVGVAFIATLIILFIIFRKSRAHKPTIPGVYNEISNAVPQSSAIQELTLGTH